MRSWCEAKSRDYHFDPIRLCGLPQPNVVCRQRKACRARLLQITGIVDGDVMSNGKFQQIRDVDGRCHVPNGQQRQLLPNLLGSSRGELAAYDAFAERVRNFELPYPRHNCAVGRSLHSLQRGVGVFRGAIQETPCQRIGCIKNEDAHSRPSAINSLMETSPNVSPSRSSHSRDLRGVGEPSLRLARLSSTSLTHSSSERPSARASARNACSISGGRFSVTVIWGLAFRITPCQRERLVTLER